MAGLSEVVRADSGPPAPALPKLNLRLKNTQNILMELRKICQHAYLTAPGLEVDTLSAAEAHKRAIQASGKLLFLKQLLPKLKERGHRVLLFSQFKIALDRIEDFLIGEGIKFLRLDGDVQQAARQKSMDAFNAPGSDIFIFVLTTRAGGVGINLATADTVIVFDPDFNPHQDLQAIARSHRYGQQKPVLVFKLMVKDSVEEQIVFKGKKKMVLDHLVVQNLNSTGDDVDYDSIIMHGAKALYEKTDDAAKERGIVYNSKNIDEMIDQMERQAEEEAKVLAEKWRLEDEAKAKGEKAEASKEARTFGFAKIWEVDQGESKEVDEFDEDKALDDDQLGLDVLLQRAKTHPDEGRNGLGKRSRQISAAELARKKRAVQYEKELQEALAMETPVKKKRKGKKGKGKEEVEEAGSDADFTLVVDDNSDSDYGGGGGAGSGAEDAGILEESTKVLGTKGMVHQQHGTGAVPGAEIAAIAAAKALRRAQKKQARLDRANGVTSVPAPSAVAGPSSARNSSSAPPDIKPRTETTPQREAREESERFDRLLAEFHQSIADDEAKAAGRRSLARSRTPADAASPVPSTQSLQPKPKAQLDPQQRIYSLFKIKEGQDVLQWLYHILREFVVASELAMWGRIGLPELPVSEREGHYDNLAQKADARLAALGYENFFQLAKVKASVMGLIRNKTSILPVTMARTMLSHPKNMGRGPRGAVGESSGSGTPAVNGAGRSSVQPESSASVSKPVAAPALPTAPASPARAAQRVSPNVVVELGGGSPSSTKNPSWKIPRPIPGKSHSFTRDPPVASTSETTDGFSPRRSGRTTPAKAAVSAQGVPPKSALLKPGAGPSSSVNTIPTPSSVAGPSSVTSRASTTPLAPPAQLPVPVSPTASTRPLQPPTPTLCPLCKQPGHAFMQCTKRRSPEELRHFASMLLKGKTSMNPDERAKALAEIARHEQCYREAGVIGPVDPSRGNKDSPVMTQWISENEKAAAAVARQEQERAGLSNRLSSAGGKRPRDISTSAGAAPQHQYQNGHAPNSPKRPRLDPGPANGQMVRANPVNNPYQEHRSPVIAGRAAPVTALGLVLAMQGDAQLGYHAACLLCNAQPGHPQHLCPVVQGGTATMKPVMEFLSPQDPRHQALGVWYRRALENESQHGQQNLDRHYAAVRAQAAGRHSQQDVQNRHALQQRLAMEQQQQQSYQDFQQLPLHQQQQLLHGYAREYQQQPLVPPQTARLQVQAPPPHQLQHPSPAPAAPAVAPAQQQQSAGPVCRFCLMQCGRDLKTCVEVHGGRKALKALIKEVDVPEKTGQEEHEARLTPLYELYQNWPK